MARLASSSDVDRQRALLWQVVEDISGDLALEPLLNRIAARACTLIGAADCTIGLYDRKLDCIRTVAVFNIVEAQPGAPLPRGWGLMGRVLELGAPVHIRYGDLPHPVRTADNDMDVIGMPIRTGGELIGVLSMGASPPTKFSATAREFLEHFARYAAFAIDNAKRHVLEQRRSARFSLIVRVAGIIASHPCTGTMLPLAADAIHELLGYTNVDIPLIDVDDPCTLVIRFRGGDHRRLIQHEDRLPIDCGIMGAAVRERRAQMVNDVASDPRYINPPGVTEPLAELAVPILFGDEVLGVLNVEGHQAFDDLDLQSLEVIAEHLALAIQGARLADRSRQLALLEERQRLARNLHDNVTQILASINMISQSLTNSWQKDPEEGARRAARLSQLAQLGFTELRALLRELTPDESSGSRGIQLPADAANSLPGRQGLASTAEHLVAAMLPSHIAQHTDFSGYRPQVPECEEALLRICQEAASNAIRHANASFLEIQGGVDADHVWIRISDDGLGFSAHNPPGMGVFNMWQRVLSLGGLFQIAARSPRGTRIEARLPRRDRAS
ncbi:MAG: GAF domain-containing protein [Arenimonas sp.]|jgi:signal transduction histidine kinase